ncbi:MAG: cysteine--tRNA ligase [Candidatus Berkelbacteria bacterium]
MKLYNTLSKSVEEFKPQDEKNVKLYTCGPTVYNYAHIGNLRTYIFEDVLRRSLEFLGYAVDHVMNMTDVDDKTIKASGGKQVEFKELTQKFEEAFLSDLKKLNIEKPTEITRATEYIEQIVDFVSDLIDRGFAYKGEDGSIYFSIEKFAGYGKLSGLDKDGIKSGARVSQDEYTKENPADFALWKAWDEVDGEIFWDTKLGKGRPGWHIECSAMSQDKLGNTLDIHAGAVDLIFPHHENEIAQSEARTGKKFVNYWVHAEHLLVDGKKMSKSLDNFYKLSGIEAKGFSPLDFRYMCLSASYRDKLNFTWESLEAAANALKRARKIITSIDDGRKVNEEYMSKFKSAVENDLNTPEALAVFWNLLRDEKVSAGDKKATALEMDKIFSLDLNKISNDEIPANVLKLVNERIAARKEKDFELSDKIRGQIEELGFSVEDAGDQSKVVKK